MKHDLFHGVDERHKLIIMRPPCSRKLLSEEDLTGRFLYVIVPVIRSHLWSSLAQISILFITAVFIQTKLLHEHKHY